jgi:tetratricopeptide (TPR) repeat protein
MRLTELIRLGFSESRQVLSDRIVDELLWGKFENPMLGIYGAHLLLLNKKLVSDRLHLVIANLRKLLGRQHPDVEALALKVAPDDVPSMLDYPPMLRKSWWYILDATVRRPDLVPLGSFAANMAGRLWGDGVWLTWMTPAAGDAVGVTGRRQGAERTPQQSDTLGDFIASLLTSAPVREAIAQIRSDTQARGVRVPLDDDTARRLVYALGIPRANVEDLLDKVNQQLTTFGTPVTSQKTKEQWLAEAHRLLGNMDYQEALNAYEQAILLDPSYARAYNDKGVALSRLGRYQEALNAFEQAIRLDPSYARAYNDKGAALSRLGRYQEALNAFEQAIRLDPSYARAYNDKGAALSLFGRYQEALNAFEQAILLDPSYARAYNDKGIALSRLGRYGEALKAYEQAIRLDPNLPSLGGFLEMEEE